MSKLVYNTETPVLFIVFNRLSTTLQVFEKIKRAQPLRLYIAGDGPRNDNDKKLCEEVRAIFSNIDWDCKVQTCFSDKNNGCRNAVSQAITWFFENEVEGIILEDDCVPADSFFGFCSTLLEKYRNDERIGHISGGNYQNGTVRGDGSYYFSSLTNVWGWAGWRRVWKDYDVDIKTFLEFKRLNYIEKISSHGPFKTYWNNMFQAHYHKANSWDYQYAYMNLVNNRLSIIPNTNLIANIGFDKGIEATHAYENHPFANIPIGEINEIIHPTFIIGDVSADLHAQEQEWSQVYSSDNEAYNFIRDKLTLLSKKAACEENTKIPKIIHQIYEDPMGPSEILLEFAKTWKENHPTWEYRFWDKEAIEDFLKNSFPDFIPIYQAYPYSVQRWDAIRYLILYKIGGLYVDFDYECVESIDSLLVGSSCCLGMEPYGNAIMYRKDLIIGNALMASVPNHNFFKNVIEYMIQNEIQLSHKALQVMETTGPFMITRVYENYKNKEEVTLLPASLIAPLTMGEVRKIINGNETDEIVEKVEKAYALHYFLGSWISQTVSKDKS